MAHVMIYSSHVCLSLPLIIIEFENFEKSLQTFGHSIGDGVKIDFKSFKGLFKDYVRSKEGYIKKKYEKSEHGKGKSK